MYKKILTLILCAFFVLTGCSSQTAVKSQASTYAVLTKKKKSELLKMKKHYDLIVVRSKGLTTEDMKVLRSITQGDIMELITISGDGTDKLLEENKARIDEWNKILGY